MKHYLFLILFLLPTLVWSQIPFALTEGTLKKEITRYGAPSLDRIEEILHGANIQKHSFNEQYQAYMSLYGKYGKTNEEPFVSVAPVYSPYQESGLSITKKWTGGVSTKASLYNTTKDFEFAGTPTKRAMTVKSLGIDIDLWKNIFGRLDRENVKSYELLSKQAGIKRKVEGHSFYIALRKLYWELVTTEESLKITTELYNSSVKQLKDAKARFRQSVADKGEVARYESQVSNRKGSIILLEYKRENLIKSLKTLLPSLAQFKIDVPDINVDGAVNEVMQCVSTIKRQGRVPYTFTLYDELSQYVGEYHRRQYKVSKRYADMDVKLQSNFKTTGVGDTGSEAMSENESGFDVGLNMTFALGTTSSTTEDIKKIVNKKRIEYEVKEISNNLDVTHENIKRSIDFLLEAIKEQGKSSDSLKIRLREIEKKYNQARVPVSAFIIDQDAYLSSELQVIETKKMIIFALLDYFTLFTETPCSFNKAVL